MVKVTTMGHFDNGSSKHHKYRDDGCKYADEYLGEGKKSSCLNCPFYPNSCVFSGGLKYIHKVMKLKRDEKIIQLWKDGHDIKEVAKMFTLGERTIQRVIKEYVK